MTSSTPCERKKSRIASSRASPDVNSFCESSPSGMRRSRAKSAPPHDGRFVATATTSNPRPTRLRRLEPFPETTTPSFIAGSSADHNAFAAGVRDDLADHLGAARYLVAIDDEDHAEAHVEGAEHLVIGDPSAL